MFAVNHVVNTPPPRQPQTEVYTRRLEARLATTTARTATTSTTYCYSTDRKLYLPASPSASNSARKMKGMCFRPHRTVLGLQICLCYLPLSLPTKRSRQSKPLCKSFSNSSVSPRRMASLSPSQAYRVEGPRSSGGPSPATLA